MLDDSTAFVGGKEYQVRISAAPAPGYAFDNKTEFRINGKLMGNYIGRTANSFEPISSEKSMYDVSLVSWAVKNGDSFETLEAGEFFKPGKVYRIEIRFEPSDDYIIDENTELYLNGDKCPRSGEAGLLRKEFEMEDISSGIYGDVDGDGYITANDALLILRSSAGMETLSSEQETAADIDCDGSLTANDALDVLRYSAGLSSHENVGKPI